MATQYKIEKKKSSEVPRIMLSYEDDDKKWHVLDSPHGSALMDDNLLEPGYEGSLGEFLCTLESLPVTIITILTSSMLEYS